MEHSPTPWKLASLNRWEEEPDAILDAKGEIICYFPEGIGDDMMGDIQHAICCVNAHDKLVAALRAFVQIGCEACPLGDYGTVLGGECTTEACDEQCEVMEKSAMKRGFAALAQLE